MSDLRRTICFTLTAAALTLGSAGCGGSESGPAAESATVTTTELETTILDDTTLAAGSDEEATTTAPVATSPTSTVAATDASAPPATLPTLDPAGIRLDFDAGTELLTLSGAVARFTGTNPAAAIAGATPDLAPYRVPATMTLDVADGIVDAAGLTVYLQPPGSPTGIASTVNQGITWIAYQGDGTHPAVVRDLFAGWAGDLGYVVEVADDELTSEPGVVQYTMAATTEDGGNLSDDLPARVDVRVREAEPGLLSVNFSAITNRPDVVGVVGGDTTTFDAVGGMYPGAARTEWSNTSVYREDRGADVVISTASVELSATLDEWPAVQQTVLENFAAATGTVGTLTDESDGDQVQSRIDGDDGWHAELTFVTYVDSVIVRLVHAG